MHGAGWTLPISPEVSASTPLLPFTTGTAAVASSIPIIGPPSTMRAGLPAKPPQNWNSVSTSVPIGTSRLPGSTTEPPLTVTSRDTRGRPKRTASRTA